MRLLAATPFRARRSSAATGAERRPRRLARAAMLASLLAVFAGEPALAQTRKLLPVPSTPEQALRVKLNQETLIVAASRTGTSYLAMAHDLVAAVAAGGGFRILPVAAEGGLANLQDLLFLRGVDMAIVPASVLAHAKATDALGGDLAQRVAHIATLYGEDVHVLVGRDTASIDDLRGRKVAIPHADETAQFTAKDILQRLGVDFESVPMEPADAVEGVRSGAIAAALLISGKPAMSIAGLPKDGSVRLLELPVAAALGEGYSPAVFLADDYPALIPPGAVVQTVAVRAVLVANNGKGGEEAARRVAKHLPALFDAIALLAVSERHPKWREVNLGAVLPGWPRVAAAEVWLSRASEQQRQLLQGHFEEFLRARKQPASSELAAAQRRKLFDEFQGWARKITVEPAAQ